MNLIKVLVRIVVFAVILIVVVIGGLWARGQSMLNGTVKRRIPEIQAAADSLSLARGRHLAFACAACHSANQDLPLAGPDTAMVHDPAFGTLHPSNLTPGGVLATYSDGELARAIREGINHKNQPMLIMPSQAFHGMSDRDVSALIGYLRSEAPVTKSTAPRRAGPIASILIAIGALPTSLQPEVPGTIAEVPEDSTAAYGAYIAPIYGCVECHGENLRGRKPGGGGPPAGPDIVAVAHQQPFEKFELAVRHGVATGGRQLSVDMPWMIYGRHLTDLETQALYQHLKSL